MTRAEPPAIGFETVTVGARFFLSSAWQSLAATSTLTINPPNLAGITIDCANIATYQNTHLYVTAGTLTINSWQDGSPLTCGSSTPFTFASVTVGANGIITHSVSTTSISYGMDFVSTGNVTIAASGAISAEGKGYLNSRIYQNVSYTISGGGSHGGSGTAGTNATYGSVSDPNTLGAGGYQGYGGGLIRIQAANIVNLGLISARASWNSIGSNLAGAVAAETWVFLFSSYGSILKPDKISH